MSRRGITGHCVTIPIFLDIVDKQAYSHQFNALLMRRPIRTDMCHPHEQTDLCFAEVTRSYNVTFPANIEEGCRWIKPPGGQMSIVSHPSLPLACLEPTQLTTTLLLMPPCFLLPTNRLERLGNRTLPLLSLPVQAGMMALPDLDWMAVTKALIAPEVANTIPIKYLSRDWCHTARSMPTSQHRTSRKPRPTRLRHRRFHPCP